jgi:RNA polymerase sigma-B factor
VRGRRTQAVPARHQLAAARAPAAEGTQPAEALEALAVVGTRIGCSLDAPLGEAEDGSLADLVAAPPRREEPEDLLLLPGLLARLPEAERQVVMLRFFGELNQDEIAVRVGFSQMHVSRLLRRAIARMRAQLLLPS